MIPFRSVDILRVLILFVLSLSLSLTLTLHFGFSPHFTMPYRVNINSYLFVNPLLSMGFNIISTYHCTYWLQVGRKQIKNKRTNECGEIRKLTWLHNRIIDEIRSKLNALLCVCVFQFDYNSTIHRWINRYWVCVWRCSLKISWKHRSFSAQGSNALTPYLLNSKMFDILLFIVFYTDFHQCTPTNEKYWKMHMPGNRNVKIVQSFGFSTVKVSLLASL